MSDEKIKKSIQYAINIGSAMTSLIAEDEELQEELQDTENFKALLHAISTIIPNRIYNQFSEGELDNLEYNHLANKLCFEFCIKND